MRIKIKTWENLAKEFNVVEKNGYTTIDCEGDFVSTMEDQLPEDRVIEVVKNKDSLNGYIWFPDEEDWAGWEISPDMIEAFVD